MGSDGSLSRKEDRRQGGIWEENQGKRTVRGIEGVRNSELLPILGYI